MTVHTLANGCVVPLEELSLRQAKRHVELIAGAANATVCFRFIHDSDRSVEAIKAEGKLDLYWPAIEAYQAQGFGVFVVVNEGGDRADQITKIRAAFIDADGIPEPVEWHVPPDFRVVRDDLHWHAYWLVKDLAVGDFRQAQQRLSCFRCVGIACLAPRGGDTDGDTNCVR